MNFTKSTLLAIACGAGLLASVAAVAAPVDPAAFQAEKDARVATIQEKLQIVQKHLGCAQAAQDHAALKVCHETAEQEHKALAAKVKAKNAERKAQKDAKK